MIKFIKKVAGDSIPNLQLSLSIEQRVKSRLRVTLSNGQEAGLDLPRGITLRHGDILSSEHGDHVRIVAAVENLSVVRTDDDLLRARICYHLGNRHTPIEIKHHFVSYPHDHVLDKMVMGLGGKVTLEELTFEPETGAYGGHSNDHEG
jgi:urease accessory protein